jgi:hypothetical protein
MESTWPLFRSRLNKNQGRDRGNATPTRHKSIGRSQLGPRFHARASKAPALAFAEAARPSGASVAEPSFRKVSLVRHREFEEQ